MADVDGVLITHEHSDHVSGLQTMVKHHRIPIYTSPGTARQLAYRIAGIESLLRPVEPGTVFSVGDCRVTCSAPPMDAAQSVDYRVDGSAAVGFLTDTGFVTPRRKPLWREWIRWCWRATTTWSGSAAGRIPIP